MQKEFNITGLCNPDFHYMVDISRKLKQIMRMIELGKYFSMNSPRQYGKTSLLAFLDKDLLKHSIYFPISISFAELSEEAFRNEATFCSHFLEKLAKLLPKNSKIQKSAKKNSQKKLNLVNLSDVLQTLFEATPKKLVLLIDEVDASSNQVVFMTFLGILREHYLRRAKGKGNAFQSVILTGVYDIKHLKLKIRPESTASNKENSPWNIAAKFTVDMSFSPVEIQTMLAEYVAATGISMNQPLIAQTIYNYTNGYPFLVSHLCKIIEEELLPEKQQKTWTKKEVDKAAQQLINTPSDINLSSMLEKLRRFPDLYQVVFQMLIRRREFSFNSEHPIISLGVQYGIFREEKGRLQIHNQIYQQTIYNYMTVSMEFDPLFRASDYNQTYDFQLPDGNLDMKKVIRRFQKFMKEQYNIKQDQVFLETNGRLLFMAFLRPILNGHGNMFREVQISAEKRLDLVITYNEFTYIVELKRWSGEKRHQDGINQLVDYLNHKNMMEGYLLIFDFRTRNRAYQEAEKVYKGKQLFMAWV